MNELLPYLLALAVGVIAGAVNTVAGSGSLLTLPMLMALGLPAGAANATNRVGILVQNGTALLALRRGGALAGIRPGPLVAPMIIGSVAGALVATQLSDVAMDRVIAVVLVAAAVTSFVSPKRWLDVAEARTGPPSLPVLGALFVVGFYGGFVQAGVGILLLIVLVVGAGIPPVSANGVKLVAVLFFTTPALVVFQLKGQVDWGLGALMAVGQGVGAFLAARFLTRSPNAGKWIRYTVLAVAIAAAVKILFGRELLAFIQ